MNEPKKRGRPSKADIAARAVTEPVLNGDTSREPEEVFPANAAAQAYALRIWEGQSISAPREWRIERVKQALEGQGLPFEGVVLP